MSVGAAVAETCTANNGEGILYGQFVTVTRIPNLDGPRPIRLDSLRERFSGATSPQSAEGGVDD